MSRPDILLICVDQMRHDRIHALGAAWMQTPNLDRLVAQGQSFTQAVTPCPVCMPARCSMFSGQLPSHHGWLSNHHPGPQPQARLPRLLREGGYATGMFGKNHSFMSEDDWDCFVEYPAPGDGAAAAQRHAWEQAQSCPRLGDGPAAGGMAGDADVARTDRALAWLQESSAAPRCCFVSYLHPHTPYHCPAPFHGMYQAVDMPGPFVEADGLKQKPRRQRFHQWNNDSLLPFDGERIRRMRETYCAQISLIDHEVGRLLDAVDASGRETLIVFTSDHGDYQGDHGLITKSPSLYDCLVRVPMIVSWPGHCLAGQRDERPLSHIDLMPSLLAVAGLPAVPGLDGCSWLPLLNDADAAWRDENVLEYGIPGDPPVPAPPWGEEQLQRNLFAGKALPWEGNPFSLGGSLRGRRSRAWKHVIDEHGEHECYDLRSDPQELVNLI